MVLACTPGLRSSFLVELQLLGLMVSCCQEKYHSNLPLSVIQLARLSGFSPIITTASPAHEVYLKSLGATHVLNRHLSADVVKAAINGFTKEPIKYVYDAISLPETQQIGWSILDAKGCLVLTLPPVVQEDEGKERKAIRTFGSPHVTENKELCKGSWAILSQWLEAGTIKVRYQAYPSLTAADLPSYSLLGTKFFLMVLKESSGGWNK